MPQNKPRPVVDNSLSLIPCPFYTGPNSRVHPKIQYDKTESDMQCWQGLADTTISEAIVGAFVPAHICLAQRQEGVCPRGLGVEVDPKLVPFRQRKE